MLPGVNKRQMEKMMKKMGMQQVDIDADQVIIKSGSKELVIDNPQVSKVNVMGQETFQIVGQAHEREIDTTPEISKDDVKTVMEQANVSEEKARKALEDTGGDLAEAIMNLTD
ncbi:nascent polypeptide-associated complex protein [Candidatus Woesearchaeota archaeon]|nr:nascent polypeptide-associated complex protein [Candidatus Woesearchaeota archaeon]